MNISGNIIRFPAPAPTPVRHEKTEQEPAKIVGFQLPETENNAVDELRARGQVFAAHRIVTRVADQLDGVVAL